jgi:hypothetical protein
LGPHGVTSARAVLVPAGTELHPPEDDHLLVADESLALILSSITTRATN